MAQTKEEERIYQREYYQTNKEEISTRKKEYQQSHKEEASAYAKEYRQNNKEKIRAGGKEYYRNNKEKIKEYQQNNKEKISAYQKKYQQSHREKINAHVKEYRLGHKEKINARMKEYHRNKRANDPKYRLNINISAAIRQSLKGNKGGRHWETLVRYTLTQFEKHMERLGAKIEDHGRGPGKWEIDHIIPQSVFNFTRPGDEDFKRCWALSNLRPLWGYENQAKQAKLERHFQPSLIFN